MKKALMSLTMTALVATTMFAGPKGVYKNQQKRIAQGVKSGQLTARETANLENRERAINGEVAGDRKANGGKLTAAERKQVAGQQRSLSKQIYADKHNGAVAKYGNNEVGRRRENQQDRIANGIANGKLNAGEAANLENREAGLNQEIKADRKANGGKLTAAERKSVNKQQNQLSNSIYKDKHN